MVGFRPARNKAAAAILRRGRTPRQQRGRRPGPALALGVRSHLPRSPWRRRALLPAPTQLAAAAARRPGNFFEGGIVIGKILEDLLIQSCQNS